MDRFTNRELSWLDFNERVLAIVEDPTTPLLERAKFAAIFSTNLDEFFQVRVAGLMEQVAAGVTSPPPDGMSPTEQLEAVRARATELMDRLTGVVQDELIPKLATEGVAIVNVDTLTGDDLVWLDEEFRSKVFPVLTPLAVDPAHPFPYISNLSLSLAVNIRDPQDGTMRFARVKVPPRLDRFVGLPDGLRFVPIEQVIASHLGDLFSGMEVIDHYMFRVTRNADLVLEESEADDLLEAISIELTRRRFGRAVRLEVETDISPNSLAVLMRQLQMDSRDIYVLRSPLDLTGLMSLYSQDRPNLKWEYWKGLTQPALAQVDGSPPNIFDVIRERDLLVQHPYDSFTSSVEEFLSQAARDPDVLAIKQTLYRTADDSAIARDLIVAAERGKQVVALVELKARFDEERNIEWARKLETAGVHVVYGLVGLKTHAKVSLVVRQDPDAIRRYAHIGTGNYNGSTARTYEDIGLFTADPDITADLGDLFNFLTGHSRLINYRKLAVSPYSGRQTVTDLIRHEGAASDGHVVMKLNSLVDAGIIEELYAASQAGARIDLLVRGICCLKPGIPGLSENITVRSLVGRYLEHSRILRFGSADRGYQFWIGSADMMPRNLDRRVEALTPVEAPELQTRLQQILDVLQADDTLTWILNADGTYEKLTGQTSEAHIVLHELAVGRSIDDPTFGF
jgi:polyphosphate kinase